MKHYVRYSLTFKIICSRKIKLCDKRVEWHINVSKMCKAGTVTTLR